LKREGRKPRIGYLSSDLRDHAVGFALTDVFETHDHHTNFEIYAYYCGIARRDSTQARIQAAVDKWTDINGLNDEEAAKTTTDDELTFSLILTVTQRTRAQKYSRASQLL
jgi:predicted O-linked N-acetylglucosamine transferase (SPINDLY family)